VPSQRSVAGEFADAPVSTAPRSAESLYPCPLTDDTDQGLDHLARDLFKAWGDRVLSVIELE
jgi:preprotein translocase subunit SecA